MAAASWSGIEIGDSFIGDPTALTTKECVAVSYKNFVKDLNVGCKVLIDDGEIEFTITEKKEDKLLAIAENSGELGSRKSVNIPGVRISLPSLTPRDLEVIDLAIKHNVDFIAHSFVRNRQDVLDIQGILNAHQSPIKIIAKIENQEGVDNIDEILEVAYGVMVARGDLGIEVPQEKIPGIQRLLIKKCVQAKKPVIVATQMLHTMIKNPRPTRAEVTDIANAIYYRTDAVMLSGETAYGDYPVEAVRTMAAIAEEAEKTKMPENDIPVRNRPGHVGDAQDHADHSKTKDAVRLHPAVSHVQAEADPRVPRAPCHAARRRGKAGLHRMRSLRGCLPVQGDQGGDVREPGAREGREFLRARPAPVRILRFLR